MNQIKIQSIINYYMDTGVITWRKTRGFSVRGKPAGSRGKITIEGKRYPIAKIVWLYMTGDLPSKPIGYHDGDKTNLKWENLYIGEDLQITSHSNCGVSVNHDNTFSLFIINNGCTTDLGIYNDVDLLLKTLKDKLSCSISTTRK